MVIEICKTLCTLCPPYRPDQGNIVGREYINFYKFLLPCGISLRDSTIASTPILFVLNVVFFCRHACSLSKKSAKCAFITFFSCYFRIFLGFFRLFQSNFPFKICFFARRGIPGAQCDIILSFKYATENCCWLPSWKPQREH
jgi:hypothetical protein